MLGVVTSLARNPAPKACIAYGLIGVDQDGRITIRMLFVSAESAGPAGLLTGRVRGRPSKTAGPSEAGEMVTANESRRWI